MEKFIKFLCRRYRRRNRRNCALFNQYFAAFTRLSKISSPDIFHQHSRLFFHRIFVHFFTDKFTINENLRFAVMVGLLGAFTTFSTFELEIFALIREKFFMTAFIYFFLSVSIRIYRCFRAAFGWRNSFNFKTQQK